MNTNDIGYLAGVIDGEGCIFASKPWKKSKDRPNGRYHFDLKVVIINTSRLMLDKCGRILSDLNVEFKDVYTPHKRIKRPMWEIRIHKKSELRKLLPVLVNDLTSKKRSAEEVMKFLNKHDDLNPGIVRQYGLPEGYFEDYVKLYNILKKQKGKSPLSVETIRQASCKDEDIVRYSK
jgi:hypothetical protein